MSKPKPTQCKTCHWPIAMDNGAWVHIGGRDFCELAEPPDQPASLHPTSLHELREKLATELWGVHADAHELADRVLGVLRDAGVTLPPDAANNEKKETP